jgi:hypothetical protein
MDELVKQALAKWPKVPHCTGWLLLDRRGTWRMRDEAAQAANAQGEPIRHAALIAFINRNYEGEPDGQWFFQNGPQRVYVELAYTPFIVRMTHHHEADERHPHASPHSLRLTDHTGARFEPAACYLDDDGGVLFVDDGAPARVAALHDHDLDLFAEHLEFDKHGAPHAFLWRVHNALRIQYIDRKDVPARFHFVHSPAALAAGKKA